MSTIKLNGKKCKVGLSLWTSYKSSLKLAAQ